MYLLEKTITFEASHRLPNHDGKCSRLHGHSWKATIQIRGTVLHKTGPKQDMLMDYYDIKKAVNPLVEDYLDHYHLNDTTGLDNPTSERLAKWIFDKLQPEFKDLLYAVSVEETCTARATYSPYF